MIDLNRFFLVCLLSLSCFAPAHADTKNDNAMCSVLLTGVENGSVDLDFFETVCSFVSERQKVLDAVSLGDLATLEGLTFNQEQSAALFEAFGDAATAKSFFERARNLDTERFLTAAVNAGFDPNLLVGPQGRDRTSLLYYALKSLNFEAAKALLKLGASPHVYDALWGEEYYRKFALEPLQWVESLSATAADKAELVISMYEAGMVWPSSPAFGANERAVKDANRAKAKIAAAYAIAGLEEPEEILPQSDVTCERLSQKNGTNWCEELGKIPAEFSDPRRGGSVLAVGLGQLMAIYDDHFYFLARVDSGYTYDRPVGIARVSLSGDRVTVFFYSDNGAGLGHCSRLRDYSDGKDPGGYLDTDRNARCWRTYTLKREFGDSTYKGPYDTPWDVSGSVMERQGL